MSQSDQSCAVDFPVRVVFRVVRSDLEELGDVEEDGEQDDEELVVLDVLLGQDGRFSELTVETDPDVSLEAGKVNKKKKSCQICHDHRE